MLYIPNDIINAITSFTYYIGDKIIIRGNDMYIDNKKDRTEQNRTEQNRTEQNRTEQNRIKPNRRKS